jgi:hypothetical protein
MFGRKSLEMGKGKLFTIGVDIGIPNGLAGLYGGPQLEAIKARKPGKHQYGM